MNRNELMTSFRNADQIQHQNGWMMYEDLARDLGYFDVGESKETKQKDINYNYTRSYSFRNNNDGIMKEEMGTSGETIGVRGHQKLPGAWFYEDVDEMSSSPISDIDEAANFVNLHASQEVRNVTQSVDVPSSEHVAEIVGRQGCKIKALRAKTNTYIKTPIRGEEPIFVVTGRPDDVAEAKYEIECAADHFTQIRASRKHSQASGGNQTAGHVTTYVRVPLRVVGLVVGPKGATIKRIQQDTHTYIITPSREREPIFEVTGMPANVDIARKEIEQHIYQRTGNMPITDPPTGMSQFSNGLPMSMNLQNAMIPPPFQNRFAAPHFGPQMPSSAPPKDYMAQNDYSMRQMRNDMGFNSLLRSFPSMRSSYQNNQMWRPTTPSPTPTPIMKEKQLTMMKLMKAVAAGNIDSQEMWSNNSLGEMIDNDMYTRNMDTFGRSSVWSSSLGFDGKSVEEKRDDSPINGLISLNGCGAGFGNLQSIWSDVRSSTSASLTSASASPSSSPSNCENEKTLCVGANLSDILTV